MNKVILIGNLTADPDLRQTTNDVSVCRFTIAVNRNRTSSDGERKADFFNCTCWRGLAESVARYCTKGSKVAVSGSIQLRQYEGNDGIKRAAVDIIADDVEFLNTKSTSRDSDEMSAQRERIGNAIDSYENSHGTARRKPTQTRIEVFDDDGDIPY